MITVFCVPLPTFSAQTEAAFLDVEARRAAVENDLHPVSTDGGLMHKLPETLVGVVHSSRRCLSRAISEVRSST